MWFKYLLLLYSRSANLIALSNSVSTTSAFMPQNAKRPVRPGFACSFKYSFDGSWEIENWDLESQRVTGWDSC